MNGCSESWSWIARFAGDGEGGEKGRGKREGGEEGGRGGRNEHETNLNSEHKLERDMYVKC